MTMTYEERLRKLEEYGLTEYQARVYLALLELGESPARQIPALSRVPRTRIYVTMSQLHEKGLVKIVPENPIKYIPVPFSEYLEREAQELRNRAAYLIAEKDFVEREFRVNKNVQPEKLGSFELIYGRKNIRETLIKSYTDAQKEVLSVGSSASPGRIVRATLPYLIDRSKTGVKIHFAFPITPNNIEKIRKIEKYVKVTILPKEPHMNIVIIDNKISIQIHRNPDDENPIKGDDIALLSNDPVIVNGMHEMLVNYISLHENMKNKKRKVDSR